MSGSKRSLTLYRIGRSEGRELRGGSELCVLRDKVSGWKRSDLKGGVSVQLMGKVGHRESRDLNKFSNILPGFCCEF
jgi:hypothetical protein